MFYIIKHLGRYVLFSRFQINHNNLIIIVDQFSANWLAMERNRFVNSCGTSLRNIRFASIPGFEHDKKMGWADLRAFFLIQQI